MRQILPLLRGRVGEGVRDYEPHHHMGRLVNGAALVRAGFKAHSQDARLLLHTSSGSFA